MSKETKGKKAAESKPFEADQEEKKQYQAVIIADDYTESLEKFDSQTPIVKEHYSDSSRSSRSSYSGLLAESAEHLTHLRNSHHYQSS
jgi:hypothetical protein